MAAGNKTPLGYNEDAYDHKQEQKDDIIKKHEYRQSSKKYLWKCYDIIKKVEIIARLWLKMQICHLFHLNYHFLAFIIKII